LLFKNISLLFKNISLLFEIISLLFEIISLLFGSKKYSPQVCTVKVQIKLAIIIFYKSVIFHSLRHQLERKLDLKSDRKYVLLIKIFVELKEKQIAMWY